MLLLLFALSAVSPYCEGGTIALFPPTHPPGNAPVVVGSQHCLPLATAGRSPCQRCLLWGGLGVSLPSPLGG